MKKKQAYTAVTAADVARILKDQEDSSEEERKEEERRARQKKQAEDNRLIPGVDLNADACLQALRGKNIGFTWNTEYANYMVEALPTAPYMMDRVVGTEIEFSMRQRRIQIDQMQQDLWRMRRAAEAGIDLQAMQDDLFGKENTGDAGAGGTTASSSAPAAEGAPGGDSDGGADEDAQARKRRAIEDMIPKPRFGERVSVASLCCFPDMGKAYIDETLNPKDKWHIPDAWNAFADLRKENPPVSRSLFLADHVTSPHVRYQTLTRNMRLRKGAKMCCLLPVNAIPEPDLIKELQTRGFCREGRATPKNLWEASRQVAFTMQRGVEKFNKQLLQIGEAVGRTIDDTELDISTGAITRPRIRKDDPKDGDRYRALMQERKRWEVERWGIWGHCSSCR